MAEYDTGRLHHLIDEISRAAIRVSLELDAQQMPTPSRCTGNAKEGFWIRPLDPPAAGGDLWEQRFPSVDDGPTGAIPTFYRNGEVQPTPTMDVYAELYQPWEEAVVEVFDGWDELPESDRFRELGDLVAGGSVPLWIHNPQAAPEEEDMPAGVPLDEDKSPALTDKLNSVVSRVTNFHGQTAIVFAETYVDPLPRAVSGQYQLCAVLASACEGEHVLMKEAGSKVMSIAEGALAAMLAASPMTGGSDVSIDPAKLKTLLNLLGIFASAAANLSDVMKVGGTIVAGATSLFGMEGVLPKGGRHGREAALAGGSPHEVLANVRDALVELNRQILDEELTITTSLGDVLDLTWRKDEFFNLPAPVLVTETDVSHLAGAPDLMRRVGRHQMPFIAAQFEAVDRAVASAGIGSPIPWMRPANIGFSAHGPHDAVVALLDRLTFLLTDTAGELRAAGETFALAADELEGVDQDAQRKLNDHAAKVADVAVPDPSRPEKPTPVGGNRP